MKILFEKIRLFSIFYLELNKREVQNMLTTLVNLQRLFETDLVQKKTYFFKLNNN
jgi:hypothetical protein